MQVSPETRLSKHHMLIERQMFSYLARLYDNAQTPKRSEQIVRRGGEILAAVRLLAGQPIHYRTPATGTEARNSSLVSVWGWKPHREIALADRVEERRRLRAAEARAKSREQKTLSRRGLPPNWRSGSVDGSDNGSRRSSVNGSLKSLKSITEAVSSSQGEETRARMHISWSDREMSRSRRRKEKAKEKETASYDTAFPDLYGGDGYVTTESIRSGMPAQVWHYQHRRETINWNYPDYHDGYDIPPLKLPSPIEDCRYPSTAIVTSEDLFQESNIFSGVPGTISLPSHRRPPASEPVSPKTTPSTTPYDTELQTSDEPPSSTYVTTDSEAQLPPVPITEPEAEDTLKAYRTVSSSDSVGVDPSGGVKLRRFRSAFRSAFPSVSRLPWSSQSSHTSSDNNSAMTSPRVSRSKLRDIRPPWTSRRPPRPTTAPPMESRPPHGKPLETIALINNTTITTERVSPPAPVTPDAVAITVEPTTGTSEDERLTRTEREYQEVLSALQDLKRELKLEREAMRAERRRSRSRGRQLERKVREDQQAERGGSRDTVETVRWWLGDVM
jgi:hypothetical protein